jgi:hypothetical protein
MSRYDQALTLRGWRAGWPPPPQPDAQPDAGIWMMREFAKWLNVEPELY